MATALSALSIQHEQKTIELDRAQLLSQPITKIETVREKKGMTIKEVWTGVRIEDLVKLVTETSSWQTVVLRSEDNYQVRLSRQEVLESGAIISWDRDGKPQKNNGTRVIVPGMRQMYWINDPVLLLVEAEQETIPPTAIVNGDLILATLTKGEIPPFEKDEGYFFRDLASALFPDVRGSYRLIARDGITHNLTLEPYLQNAVVAAKGDTLFLKSPDMPGGMWIKELVYIQKDDLGVVFTKQLKDFAGLAALIDIDLSKTSLCADDKKKTKLDAETPFTDAVWQKCRKVLLWK